MNQEKILINAIEKGTLLPSTFENIQIWLNSKDMPIWAKSSIESLIAEELWDELNDRFYKSLDFGTGGMRGRTIGRVATDFEYNSKDGNKPLKPAVGTNVLNDFTLIKATIGLFRYVSKYLKEEGSIDIPRFIIAYDVRYFSKHFAELCASSWIQLGGHALLFEEARSTPQLSFSVRYYKAHCGAVITASHNPYHDNGFKVYFDDGAQVVSPHAEQIVESVNEVKLESTIPYINKRLDGVSYLGLRADDIYKALLRELISFETEEALSPLKVIFSPIHGTGGIISVPLLKEMGLDVHEVESQKLMDGAFPSVESPNPENASALKMALEKAEEIKGDIVIATDPDADRMGVAVRNEEGKMELLTGNQIGALMADYRIQILKDRKILPKKGSNNAVLIKTFVTTPLQDAIGSAHGLKVINTLTGFKWIGKKLAEYESVMKNQYRKIEGIAINYDLTDADVRAEILMDYSNFFVFGAEESYGFLAHDSVRDKDANASALLFSEMAAHYKSKGSSVMNVLKSLYNQHGYYCEKAINLYFEGAAGAQKIVKILESYRSDPPKEFGPLSVIKINDFGVTDFQDSDGSRIPKQDFFLLECEHGFSFAVRASGTEPKIKFYVFGHKAVIGLERLEKVKIELDSEIIRFMNRIKVDAINRAG